MLSPSSDIDASILQQPTLGKAKASAIHNRRVHILLIEDDLHLGRALQASLKVEGLSSEWRRRAEPGAVVAKGVLAQKLEPLGEPLDFAATEVHVSNLRRKIGSTRVHTVRGVGYMLAW